MYLDRDVAFVNSDSMKLYFVSILFQVHNNKNDECLLKTSQTDCLLNNIPSLYTSLTAQQKKIQKLFSNTKRLLFTFTN